MKAIHSLWTATPEFRLTREAAIVMSASAAYTNRAFADTELVTDCKGLRIAQRLGWQFGGYDLRLEDFCPPYAKHVWALGKIAAQSWQTAQHIHIDNDVLVFNPPPRRILGADLAVQSVDEPEGYFGPELDELIKDCGLPRGEAAFNTGIIAWRDLDACAVYCKRAVDIAMVAAKASGDGTLCSLVAEQYYLGHFCRKTKYRPECAIPLASMAVASDFDWQFMHAWGGTKKSPAVVQKVAARFARDFPGLYQKARHGYALLKEKGLAV